MPTINHPIKSAILTTLAIFLLAVPAAQAHKIKIFAMTEGATVTGYAYAPGGVRLPNNKVTVLGQNNEKLAELTTDAQGNFSFTPKKRSDLHFEMDTGDGHRTSFLIQAEELPTTLPTDKTVAPKQVTKPQPPSTKPVAATTPSQDELATMIDLAVARNIRPLREQIEAYEQKVRFHDILGGIGYILGLAGIAAYLGAGKTKDGR